MPAVLVWGSDHYIIKYSGVVTVDESVDIYGQLVGSPQFDACHFGILDCNGIERVNYSEMDYKRHAAIAMSAAKINNSLRIALVVPNEAIEKSIQPFLKSASEQFPSDWERHVFKDYAAAAKWASAPKNQTVIVKKPI